MWNIVYCTVQRITVPVPFICYEWNTQLKDLKAIVNENLKVRTFVSVFGKVIKQWKCNKADYIGQTEVRVTYEQQECDKNRWLVTASYWPLLGLTSSVVEVISKPWNMILTSLTMVKGVRTTSEEEVSLTMESGCKRNCWRCRDNWLIGLRCLEMWNCDPKSQAQCSSLWQG